MTLVPIRCTCQLPSSNMATTASPWFTAYRSREPLYDTTWKHERTTRGGSHTFLTRFSSPKNNPARKFWAEDRENGLSRYFHQFYERVICHWNPLYPSKSHRTVRIFYDKCLEKKQGHYEFHFPEQPFVVEASKSFDCFTPHIKITYADGHRVEITPPDRIHTDEFISHVLQHKYDRVTSWLSSTPSETELFGDLDITYDGERLDRKTRGTVHPALLSAFSVEDLEALEPIKEKIGKGTKKGKK